MDKEIELKAALSLSCGSFAAWWCGMKQIWTALIAILLLKYLQMRSRLSWSLSNLLALLRQQSETSRQHDCRYLQDDARWHRKGSSAREPFRGLSGP